MNVEAVRTYVRQRIEIAPSGCWLWRGPKLNGGYGAAHVAGLKTTAHRVAFMAWVGPVPRGLELDHVCKNILCVRPDHLEAVTHLENVRRSAKANATHCVRGHRFDEANTYVKSNGCRSCRKCNARRSRELRSQTRSQKERR